MRVVVACAEIRSARVNERPAGSPLNRLSSPRPPPLHPGNRRKKGRSRKIKKQKRKEKVGKKETTKRRRAIDQQSISGRLISSKVFRKLSRDCSFIHEPKFVSYPRWEMCENIFTPRGNDQWARSREFIDVHVSLSHVSVVEPKASSLLGTFQFFFSSLCSFLSIVCFLCLSPKYPSIICVDILRTCQLFISIEFPLEFLTFFVIIAIVSPGWRHSQYANGFIVPV